MGDDCALTLADCIDSTIPNNEDVLEETNSGNIDLCLAFGFNSLCGEYVLNTYRDYFTLLARCGKQNMKTTLMNFFKNKGATPGSFYLPVYTSKPMLLRFQAFYTWSREEISEIPYNFSLLFDLLKRQVKFRKVLVQLDYFPMWHVPAKLVTHMIVIEQHENKIRIYSDNKQFIVDESFSLDEFKDSELVTITQKDCQDVANFSQQLLELFHPVMRATFYRPVVVNKAAGVANSFYQKMDSPDSKVKDVLFAVENKASNKKRRRDEKANRKTNMNHESKDREMREDTQKERNSLI